MSDCPATFLKHWHVRVVDPVSPQLLVGHGDEVQPGAYVVHGHIGMHAGNAVHGCCEVGGEPLQRYWLAATTPFDATQVTERTWRPPSPQVTEHAPQLLDAYW